MQGILVWEYFVPEAFWFEAFCTRGVLTWHWW